MSMYNKLKSDGISLRFVYKVLLIIAVIISVLLITVTYRSSSTFNRLSRATDEYIEMQKAAYELMDASDYLTEMAQRFTSTGDVQFLNAYFTEAFETKRREDAIAKMSANPHNQEALEKLQMAMQESLELMDREYYAMKLVVDAQHIQDYPEVLDQVKLSDKDKNLSAPIKMTRAQRMVLDNIYYGKKDLIRKDMQESLQHLETVTHTTQSSLNSEMSSKLQFVRIFIIVQTISIMVMIWLTARLGINPVLQAVDNIKDDSPIPEIGAIEFRYLAKTYNKMYKVYKSSIERLNYKASHDELTKAYNRSGYELILSSLDLKTTYVLLFDTDNFKKINDSYGHDVGDSVLKRIAESIRHNFRSDDYICRIGGDEFVVFMVHTDKEQKQLISSKVKQINEELAVPDQNLPKVTLSAGIVHGTEGPDAETIIHYADKALYAAKNNGRNCFAFYEDIRG